MRKNIRFVILSVICFILVTSLTGYSRIPQGSGDLKNEIISITGNMPGSGSEGYVKPALADLNNWREIISEMLDGEYLYADSLIQDKFPFYELILFTDTSFQDKEYYLLKESMIPSIDRGWGTFIISNSYDREIAIEVPHALHDINTNKEGIDVFRFTGSHYFIMSGTHRCANSEESVCSGTTSACGSSGPYRVSDMAHYDKALFQTLHEEVTVRNPQLYSINLHGHAQSSCQDFFMTNGHATLSKPILFNLKSSLLTSGGVTAAVAGDGTSSCPLIGSTNVQGRFTNGSSDPCIQAASSTTGYFIHIEQSSFVRNNPSVYAKLIDAVNANIQPVTGLKYHAEMIPSHLDLISVYPNPFNPSTTIEYNVIEASFVTLKIYDALGRELETVVKKRLPVGNYYHRFDGSQRSSGVYYARIQFNDFSQTVKFTLIK